VRCVNRQGCEERAGLGPRVIEAKSNKWLAAMEVAQPGKHERSDEERAQTAASVSAWWATDTEDVQRHREWSGQHAREIQHLAAESRRGVPAPPKSEAGLERCREGAHRNWENPEYAEKVRRILADHVALRQQAASEKSCGQVLLDGSVCGAKPIRSHDWCNRHYLSWYRYGDPLAADQHYGPRRLWTDDDLRAAIAASESWAEVCRRLNGSFTNVKRVAQQLQIDTSHFTGKGGPRRVIEVTIDPGWIAANDTDDSDAGLAS
jgi:hypothetical protein